MAHFQAGIQGNRGQATRLGTGKSGIYAFARGWQGGARIDMWEGEDGEDRMTISVGLHGNVGQTTIVTGTVKEIVANAKGIARSIDGETICY